MSKAISKTALKELIALAEEYCDHPEDDHAKGHCDYVVISQTDLSALLEDAQ